MCVQVQISAFPFPAYDPEQQLVRIPPGLRNFDTLRVVQTVMAELGAEQPLLAAVCWCGEEIALDRVPMPRTGEVIRSGA